MIGEIRCLNCARHLADVFGAEAGRMRLAPPAGQDAAPILVEQSGRGLRCLRCGGRALLEASLDGAAARREIAGRRLSSAA